MARIALIVLAALLGLSQPAAAQSFNAQQQAEIRALVRDYLVNNPSVLDEAINALSERKQAERIRRMQHDPRDFSIGPQNAPVTFVEFFDYRCPFCQAALPWMMDLVATRHDIRIVFKEMPIEQLHGPIAVEASRASIAAMPQGRYLQFHRALMAFRGELTSDRIDQIARQSGIDVARMRRSMRDNDRAITAHLEDNTALAVDLLGNEGLGTPTFFVNSARMSGFGPDSGALLSQQISRAALEAREMRAAQR